MMQTLDTSAAAQQHLFKTLSKIKSAHEHPDLPSQVKNATKVSSDPATLNVIARLCKSNQGKAALDAAVADVQKALGIDSRKAVVVRQKGSQSRGPGSGNPQSHEPDRRCPSESVELENEDDDESDLEPDVDRPNLDQDPTGDEFSDFEDLEQRLLAEASENRSADSISNKYDVEADLSLSSSESGSASHSPEPQKAPTTKKASFLPSLTMGGYISGSESEAEDIDIAPKKNRRGQRARQQIWEQKYGDSAKHLQKQGRAIEFDRRQGAVEKNNRSRRNFDRQRRTNAKHTVSQEKHPSHSTLKPVKDIKKTHRDDGGALHPSWEAAKKAKERKGAPVAFSGKKITFDG
jgi:hypothetical protein